MANTKKYVSFDKLGLYDEKIKGVISAGDKAAKDYADSLAGNYDAAGSAATVQGKLDDEITRAKAREDEIAGLVATAQGEVDTLEQTHATDKAALEAKDAELAASIEALDAKVGDLPEGTTAKDVVDYVNIKTAGIATDAALEELQNQLAGAQNAIDAIEEDYLKAADKTELAEDIAEVQANVDTLAGTHTTDKAALEAAIALKADKTALDEVSGVANAAATKVALEEEVNRAKGEEARIEGLVTAEAAKAREEEGKLDGRLAKVETFFELAEGEKLDEAKDTLIEIQKLIDDDAAAADAMVKDIAANKKAIEDHVATDHDFAAADEAVKSELNTEIAKKADKTTVEGIDGRLTTAEGKITTVEGKVSTLEGEMDAVEAAVATKAEAQALTDAVAALEGVDAGLAERLDEVEAMLGDGDNSVADMIATAKQEAIDAAAGDAETKANAAKDAAIAKANELNTAMDTRVAAVEAASATHALASDLTALDGRVTTAEGEIDTLQTEMDAVEALAAANKAAHEANAAAIALKASQADLEAVSGRVTTLETWHNNFTEVSEEEINSLF